MTISSNYTPLSPQSFLRRNARVFPNKTAVIYGDQSYTYQEFFERACRQANGLQALGIGHGDVVAVLAPNTPPHLDSTFGVHMAGAVLVAINTRLSPDEIAFIIGHAEAKVLLVDWEYLPAIRQVIGKLSTVKTFLVAQDNGSDTEWLPPDAVDYEEFLKTAPDTVPEIYPADENDMISINYTSGTTGNPKGVMYSHRGAYLNALCSLLEMGMSPESVYLWTLPMFHCNGWCYTWGVTAIGGTHVCLRSVVGDAIIEKILEHKVTHFCGAPIVLGMIADGARDAGVERFQHQVTCSTAAAPPPPVLIETMLKLNVNVIHVYGLTETYGPTTVCEVQPDWRDLPVGELAGLMARQGVPYIVAEDVRVLDPEGNPVPADGETMGEVCMRGNIVMMGYFRNPKASEEALRDGWFHSGDLGVMHADGYIELKDRAKDIIISGGENISTIEVENTLFAHPDIQDVAVVSRPDDKWGEVPVAFVTPAEGTEISEKEVIDFCRERLAHYKAPKSVYFEVLPRTSTGKVQKYVLRERLWEGREKRIN